MDDDDGAEARHAAAASSSSASASVVARAREVFGASAVLPVDFGHYDSFYSSLRDSERSMRRERLDSAERMHRHRFRGDGASCGGRRRRREGRRGGTGHVGGGRDASPARGGEASPDSHHSSDAESAESSTRPIAPVKALADWFAECSLASTEIREATGADVVRRWAAAPARPSSPPPPSDRRDASPCVECGPDDGVPSTEGSGQEQQLQCEEGAPASADETDVHETEVPSVDIPSFLSRGISEMDDMSQDMSVAEKVETRGNSGAEGAARGTAVDEEEGGDFESRGEAVLPTNDIKSEDQEDHVKYDNQGEIDDTRIPEKVELCSHLEVEVAAPGTIVDVEEGGNFESIVVAVFPTNDVEPENEKTRAGFQRAASASAATTSSVASACGDIVDSNDLCGENESYSGKVHEHNAPEKQDDIEEAHNEVASPDEAHASTPHLITPTELDEEFPDTAPQSLEPNGGMTLCRENELCLGQVHKHDAPENQNDGQKEHEEDPDEAHPSTTHLVTPTELDEKFPDAVLQSPEPKDDGAMFQKHNHDLPMFTPLPASNHRGVASKTEYCQATAPLPMEQKSELESPPTSIEKNTKSSALKRKPKNKIPHFLTPLKRQKLDKALQSDTSVARSPWGTGVQLYNGRSVERVRSFRRCENRFCRWEPRAHPGRAACERCWALASRWEREAFVAEGRHLRIARTTGGCPPSCTLFPVGAAGAPAGECEGLASRQEAVRLCRRCFGDVHHVGIR